MPRGLLLDTHIWLWSVLEPRKLSPKVTRLLRSPLSQVWASPVSSWEIVLLCERGRLVLQPDATAWITRTLALATWREATMNHDVALAVDRIFLPHRDPADRLLAATARAYDLTLITSDQNILSGSGFAALSNG